MQPPISGALWGALLTGARQKLDETAATPAFPQLTAEITACTLCPRLVRHREEIGILKRRAYRDQNYWSRHVPGFGDPDARLLRIGLAPGADGANRTGRMFTGDRSGEFLLRALWETGFANQPDSVSRADGLQLNDAYITAAVRCVPPMNKPEPGEIATCRRFLVRELALLSRVQVVVVLGAVALQAYLHVLVSQGHNLVRCRFPFGHGKRFETCPGGPVLLTCFHPSQQNTSTGKLNAEMLRDLFVSARALLSP